MTGSEPAFPSQFVKLEGSGYDKGMSIRDYFAAQALIGVLAHSACPPTNEGIAAVVYGIADAMLCHRENKP